MKFSKVVPNPGRMDILEAFWACFDPFSAVLAHFSPFHPLPGGRDGVQWGPKPVNNDLLQRWPQSLWEGQTDLSGPLEALLTSSMAIPGTGYRYTRQRAGGRLGRGGGSHPPTVVQYARRAKSNMNPKPVKSDVFQKWPRTVWGCETDLKQIQ